MLRRLNLIQYFLPCCLLGVMLMGLGGKLWLIFNFGTPVPDAAQWQAGVPALAPEWAAGNVVLAHNDNPVALPLLARAVLGALIHANHQWDDRVTTIVNALLLVGTFAAVLAAGARRLGWTSIWASALCTGLLLALPLDWNQSLAGSALPNRLAMFLALPSVWVLLDRDIRSPFWLPAAAALLLANTAADWVVMVCLAAGAVAAIRLCTTRVRRGRDVAVLGLTAVGVGLHLWLYPHSWTRLVVPPFGTLLANLTVPWPTMPWFALIIQAPLVIRLVMTFRDRDRKHSLAPFAAVGAAALLTVLWMTAQPATPQSEALRPTLDIILLLIALSFATLTQLWRMSWQSIGIRTGLTVAWIAVLVAGLDLHMESAVSRELPEKNVHHTATLEALEKTVLNGDASALDALVASERLLPDTGAMAELLKSSRLRPVLPFCLQSPVQVGSGPATTRDFTPLNTEQFSIPTPKTPAWAGGPAAEVDGGTMFVSLPLPSSSAGVLRFTVAGDLGTASFPFALRSLSTGEYTQLELEGSTGERWRTINLPRPADPVVLVAGPAALGAWGAFTHPVEMGTFSWYAGKLAKNWLWFAASGSFCFAAALLLPLAPRARPRDTFALAPDGRIVRVSAKSRS